MIKKLLFPVLLSVTFCGFSQKDLGLPAKKNKTDEFVPFIANDGSFEIFELQQGALSLPIMVNSYDAHGNKLDSKTLDLGKDVYGSLIFHPEHKVWFNVYIGKSKITIVQIDLSGKVTHTDVLDKTISGRDKLAVYITEGGLKVCLYSYKYDYFPHIMVNYNREDKSYKTWNFKNLAERPGQVAFIGSKGNLAYFVNSVEEKKAGVVRISLLAMNNGQIISTTPVGNTPVKDRKLKFDHCKIINPVSNMHGDNLYFTIDSYGTKDENLPIAVYTDLEYNVYKIDPDNNISNIRFTVPMSMSALPHFPLNFMENGETTFISLKDDFGKRLLIESDFDSDEAIISMIPRVVNIPDLIYYGEDYQDFFDKKGTFRACNGYRRLIIIDEKGGTLYLQKDE